MAGVVTGAIVFMILHTTVVWQRPASITSAARPERGGPQSSLRAPRRRLHTQSGHYGAGVRRRVVVHLYVDAVDLGRCQAGVLDGVPARLDAQFHLGSLGSSRQLRIPRSHQSDPLVGSCHGPPFGARAGLAGCSDAAPT